MSALRRSLEDGEIEPLAAAYERAGPHRREFLVQSLTYDLHAVPALDAWPSFEPDSALALLARGAQSLSAALAVRGAYAVAGGPPRDSVPDRLRAAETDLHRSCALEDDGVAWSQLIISGRGLGCPAETLRERYARALEASPELPFAADQLLHGLGPKWSGSNEEMFEFARRTSAAAPAGDPRHRLIPIAHFERAVELRDDDEGLRAYRADESVQAEIVAAAERWASAVDVGIAAQQRLTLNWFAMSLSFFRRFDEARPLLETIDKSPTHAPWNFFTSDASVVFLSYREKAGLPA